jgi:hypothetical protein
VKSEAEPDAAPPHAVAARPNYVKLNHPVVMIFSCVGDGTPRCVNVQSAGQIKVRPFLGCTIKFWWQNSVPPAREPRVDSHEIMKTASRRCDILSTRSETAQNPKSDHSLHRKMETIHEDGARFNVHVTFKIQ